jgi:hypothetical protein
LQTISKKRTKEIREMMKGSTIILSLAIAASTCTTQIQSFAPSSVPGSSSNSISTSKYDPRMSTVMLHAAKGGNQNEENDELVTKEMFLRNMLDAEGNDNTNDNTNESTNAVNKEQKEPMTGKVKRKKKRSSRYKVVDNRDSLPFLVKVTTPDPYTNNEVMQKNARKNTEQLAKGAKSKKNKKTKDASKKRHNMVGMDGVDSIASSIYKRKKDGTLDQVLGEFALDKSTNCGDILEIGDGVEYKVQKARCQYKYVGGKRFVMTRKILEVKEVKRLLVEKEIKQLFDKDGISDDNDTLLDLE